MPLPSYSTPTTNKVFGISPSDIVYRAATLADLRILADSLKLADNSGQQVAYLEGRTTSGDGGEGIFRWNGNDLSAEVKNDTQSGIYVAPDSDPTGASGAWARQHSGKSVKVQWFGATGVGDDSKAFIGALAVKPLEITGEGGIFEVENVEINESITIKDMSLTKRDINKNLFSILIKDMEIKFINVTFDGNYSGIPGQPDIICKSRGEKGLRLSFKDCHINNVSSNFLFTGYFVQNAIQKISVFNCISNGNHMPRSFSKSYAIFSVHNTELLLIEKYKNQGDGYFEFTSTSQEGVERAPMPSILTTNTRVIAKDISIKDEGGIILYTGNHFSYFDNIFIENCFYGLRIQNARNIKISKPTIVGTRSQFTGAISYSAYTRLETGKATTPYKNIHTLSITNGYFENNEIDISLVGNHRRAGLFEIDNTRCRFVNISSSTFIKVKQCNIVMQDVDKILIGRNNHFYGSQGRYFFRLSQTEEGGLGKITIKDNEFEADLNTDIALISPSSLTSIQNNTQLEITKNRFIDAQPSKIPFVYFRYAGEIRFTENFFNKDLDVPFKALDHNKIVFTDNYLSKYPAFNVQITPTTIAQLISDQFKSNNIGLSRIIIPSEKTPTPPENQNFQYGSTAILRDPGSKDYTKYIFGSSGWKYSGPLVEVP